jgi:hypothetical protein
LQSERNKIVNSHKSALNSSLRVKNKINQMARKFRVGSCRQSFLLAKEV